MCLVFSGSVRHFDIALLWKLTNHDDLALTVRNRSLVLCTLLPHFSRKLEFYKPNTAWYTSVCTVSSQGGRSEQKSLQIQDRSKSRSRDYGATAETEAAPEEVWTKKFETMERILENQRKFLEDHNIKIQEIENVIQKIVAET